MAQLSDEVVSLATSCAHRRSKLIVLLTFNRIYIGHVFSPLRRDK